jgi:soluble lytic murein transglycosylase-like protein
VEPRQAPAPGELDAFLDHVDTRAPVELTQRLGPGGAEHVVRIDPASPDARRRIAALAREPRYELLVRVRPRTAEAPRRPGAVERANPYPHSVRALWVECATAEARDRLRAYPLRPHLIVRAGATLHAAWRLDEPIDDPGQARHANRRLADQVRGTAVGVEVSDRVPVPGSRDWRTTPPTLVRVTYVGAHGPYGRGELLTPPSRPPAVGTESRGGVARDGIGASLPPVDPRAQTDARVPGSGGRNRGLPQPHIDTARSFDAQSETSIAQHGSSGRATDALDGGARDNRLRARSHAEQQVQLRRERTATRSAQETAERSTGAGEPPPHSGRDARALLSIGASPAATRLAAEPDLPASGDAAPGASELPADSADIDNPLADGADEGVEPNTGDEPDGDEPPGDAGRRAAAALGRRAAREATRTAAKAGAKAATQAAAAGKTALAVKAAPIAAAVLLVLLVVLALLVGAGVVDVAESDACQGEPLGRLVAGDIPAGYAALYEQAGQQYGLDPAVLAAIGKVETDHGRLKAPGVRSGQNSAGAMGPMQFLAGTWSRYGIDGNHDGTRDVYDPRDAVPGAAHYLKASGAPRDWRRAIFAYNHADWYVAKVLAQAERYRASGGTTAVTTIAATTGQDCQGGQTVESVHGVKRVGGGGRIVAIPGFPGERIDSRLLADLAYLEQRYKIRVTDGYAPTGHAAGGEHPIGLAVDLVPGPGGSWDDIDRLAAWAEPTQNHPRPPFRWVGYDGDSGHGRGNHLHLSWQHGGERGPPASWVLVMDLGG